MKSIWQDWAVNPEVKARLILLFFRVANRFAVQKQCNKVVWILGLPLLALYRLIVEWLLCVELPAKTEVGPGLKLRHGQGLVVHPETKIGANVTLRHNTTIGNKIDRNGNPTQPPSIEDEVDIGCNSVVVGPVRIGRGGVIGAGSVVTKDVPCDAIMVGNPARNIANG